MQKSFETLAPITAVFDVPAGRIQLIATDRADTTIDVRPANAAKSRDVKVAERIAVAYADGVLRIDAPAARNQYFGPSGSIEVTVQLPSGSRVEAKTSVAELRGVGRFGDVSCEAFGAVEIDETASARLVAYLGDVTVGRLTGPGEITTEKGDISIAEASSDNVVLRTRMGNVTIGASRGVSASLDAATRHGRIRNTLKNTEGAAAELRIHATVDLGDIVAQSL
jgi:hypothetical protein